MVLRRESGLLLALLACAAVLLAGCGSAAGPRPPAGSPPSAAAASRGDAPEGSRTRAVALARAMLAGLALPKGSHPAAPDPVPSLLRAPAGVSVATPSVSRHLIDALPGPMAASYRYLLSHVPAGDKLYGNGSQSGPGGTEQLSVTYSLRVMPRGISVATVTAGVIPGPRGSSLLRADVQVVWFPPRSAAEELRPAAFRAVVITEATDAGKRLARVVVTSRAAIAGLARLLDRLPAATGGVTSCPGLGRTYRLAFQPASGRPPQVLVTAPGCASDSVTVAGRSQPPLADPRERVAAAARRLLASGGK